MFDGTSLSKKKKEKNSQYERMWSGSNSTLKLLVCRNTSILSNFPYHPFFTIVKKYPQPSAEETANLANLHNCQKISKCFCLHFDVFSSGKRRKQLPLNFKTPTAEKIRNGVFLRLCNYERGSRSFRPFRLHNAQLAPRNFLAAGAAVAAGEPVRW